jgi:hypothetical protein
MAFGILGWEALGLIILLAGAAAAYGALTRKHRVSLEAGRLRRRKARIRAL